MTGLLLNKLPFSLADLIVCPSRYLKPNQSLENCTDPPNLNVKKIALFVFCFCLVFCLQTEKWDEDREEGTYAGIK